MKVSENVFMLKASKGSYVYLVRDEEGTVLVDTGLTFMGPGIIKEVKSLDLDLKEIRHILLTHNDLDHVGNVVKLQELTGAQIWASKEDIPYILGDKPRPGFKKYMSKIFRVKKPKEIKAYIPGESLCGFRAISTPGHTPGHVCLQYKDILFVGDLVKSIKGSFQPYPKAWNWNNEKLLESIKAVAGLEFQWICPAHGEPALRGVSGCL